MRSREVRIQTEVRLVLGRNSAGLWSWGSSEPEGIYPMTA